MMYRHTTYCLTLLITCVSTRVHATELTGPLKNSTLHKLDGIAMNAKTIKDMISLYQLMTRLIQQIDQYGDGVYARVIQEFEENTLPFLHSARALKEFMVPLIEEWALLHNRTDTELLAWSSMGNNEHEFIKKRIATSTNLRRFLDDLRSFLSDLVESCPKGYTAFVKRNKAA